MQLRDFGGYGITIKVLIFPFIFFIIKDFFKQFMKTFLKNTQIQAVFENVPLKLSFQRYTQENLI